MHFGSILYRSGIATTPLGCYAATIDTHIIVAHAPEIRVCLIAEHGNLDKGVVVTPAAAFGSACYSEKGESESETGRD